MTNQQNELRALIAYEIGVLGQEYNPAVIFDTLNVLHRQYSVGDLRLMIVDSHKEFCGISEAIQLILADTYSAAAMGFEPGNYPCMGEFDANGDVNFEADTHIATPLN